MHCFTEMTVRGFQYYAVAEINRFLIKIDSTQALHSEYMCTTKKSAMLLREIGTGNASNFL
jgi:hypothetical protein